MLILRLLILLICLCNLLPAYSAPVPHKQSELGAALSLPIIEWSDDAVPSRGIIVALHSLMFSGASFENFARYLAGIGYTVYAPDIRGFGRWRDEYSKVGSGSHADFAAAKNDLVRILTKLREGRPDTPIILVGESMGADYALLLASGQEASLIDGAIITAPGFKFQFHPQRQVPVDVLHALLRPKKQINFEHYLERYLRKNGELTKTWRNDDTVTRTISLSELIADRNMSRSAYRHLDRIPSDFPILVLAGADDQVFSSKAISKRVKRFGSGNVSVRILPNKGHLLLEGQPVDAQTRDIISTWLASQPRQHLAK